MQQIKLDPCPHLRSPRAHGARQTPQTTKKADLPCFPTHFHVNTLCNEYLRQLRPPAYRPFSKLYRNLSRFIAVYPGSGAVRLGTRRPEFGPRVLPRPETSQLQI
jgi:hypothetical protein